MATPLLNIDAGELPDEPEELYRLAHVVSIACGGHAGDDASMDRVLSACRRFGTRVGAHPSYPDREGFGRREIAMTAREVEERVAEQCARLAERAARAGLRVEYVKPHGALYHAANRDPELGRAVVTGAARALGGGIRVIGPPKGELRRACTKAGLAFSRERFCDRGERADGSLVPRGEPGALVTDPARAAERAAIIARQADAETVCVHGDTPGAVDIARAVRRALDDLLVPVRFGDNAWRWPIGPDVDRRELLDTLRALPGITDAIVTEDHACAIFEDGAAGGACDDVGPCEPARAPPYAPPRRSPTRDHVVRVRYDGPDLAEVAEYARLRPEDVVRRHVERTYTVSFIGFLPGFAYLREVDPDIAMPRRGDPRARVPAGAVAIAAGYTGIYPFASPGGWNLIGTAVDFAAFDRDRGALLEVGDRVRFEAVR